MFYIERIFHKFIKVRNLVKIKKKKYIKCDKYDRYDQFLTDGSVKKDRSSSDSTSLNFYLWNDFYSLFLKAEIYTAEAFTRNTD